MNDLAPSMLDAMSFKAQERGLVDEASRPVAEKVHTNVSYSLGTGVGVFHDSNLPSVILNGCLELSPPVRCPGPGAREACSASSLLARSLPDKPNLLDFDHDFYTITSLWVRRSLLLVVQDTPARECTVAGRVLALWFVPRLRRLVVKRSELVDVSVHVWARPLLRR